MTTKPPERVWIHFAWPKAWLRIDSEPEPGDVEYICAAAVAELVKTAKAVANNDVLLAVHGVLLTSLRTALAPFLAEQPPGGSDV